MPIWRDSSRANTVGAAVSGSTSPEDTIESARRAAVAKVHNHCGIFTEPEVACGILNLIGWTTNVELMGQRLLEPSCGDGSFLVPAVERLLESARLSGKLHEPALSDAILAFEFDPGTAERARQRVRDLLEGASLGTTVARRIADRWVRCDDFLLATKIGTFSHVVGNPPYMRWSKLPSVLRRAYEERLPSQAARGDLCLAFVWRAVELSDLANGRVAFLCVDRWLRCAYGEKARMDLAKSVRLATHLEVHALPVFLGPRKVGAYAAITVLDRNLSGGSIVAEVSSSADLLRRLSRRQPRSREAKPSKALGNRGGAVLAGVQLGAAFQRMAETGVCLREAGVEIRCGIALGSAPVFIASEGGTDVEPDRLLPYLRTRDLTDDGRAVSATRLINVWSEAGDLVDLAKYPKLKAHLELHRKKLGNRACATRPEHWYRTIDRIDLAHVAVPKILVAGMAKTSRVALSPGGAQPSNALYAITSIDWPLGALFALFRIGLLDAFAQVLAPRFSGNSKRFDGNVLRQVRIPLWAKVDASLKKSLFDMDITTATPRPDLIADLYGIRASGQRKALAMATARPTAAVSA
jgi:adenine-specific DNA-methyltransferase